MTGCKKTLESCIPPMAIINSEMLDHLEQKTLHEIIAESNSIDFICPLRNDCKSYHDEKINVIYSDKTKKKYN